MYIDSQTLFIDMFHISVDFYCDFVRCTIPYLTLQTTSLLSIQQPIFTRFFQRGRDIQNKQQQNCCFTLIYPAENQVFTANRIFIDKLSEFKYKIIGILLHSHSNLFIQQWLCAFFFSRIKFKSICNANERIRSNFDCTMRT